MEDLVDFTRNADTGYPVITRIANKLTGTATFRTDIDYTFAIESEEVAAAVGRYVPGALEQYKSGQEADKELPGARRGLSSGSSSGRPVDRDVSLSIVDDGNTPIYDGDATIQSARTAWDGEDYRYTVRIRHEGLTPDGVAKFLWVEEAHVRLDYKARQLKTDGGDPTPANDPDVLPLEKSA